MDPHATERTIDRDRARELRAFAARAGVGLEAVLHEALRVLRGRGGGQPAIADDATFAALCRAPADRWRQDDFDAALVDDGEAPRLRISGLRADLAAQALAQW